MGAIRGSRGSPEVGSRRVNDASISRIYFFLLGSPGLPGDAVVYMPARVRLRSAASRLLVAIVWVSDIYAASTAGIFQSSCCCFVQITAITPGNLNGSFNRRTCIVLGSYKEF